MKIIIPMAGMGKRMRPHTLTIPKPLIPIAGKPIVQHLCEEIAKVVDSKIDEIAFVVGRFGEQTEKELVQIAENIGAKGSIYYQDEALGTAHAVFCAEKSLQGPVIIAFADTLFKAQFNLDKNADAVIWVNHVKNPESFGVVETDTNGTITRFIEKPKNFVSDLAIIGIYYFKDGQNLRNELSILIENKHLVNGEYQLTDVLENMKNKQLIFKHAAVTEWLDCGNKDATVNTNQRILFHTGNSISKNSEIINSTIIPPCFIGTDCKISNSIIGPYASIGNKCEISHSIMENSIIQNHSHISNIFTKNSMIGSFTNIKGSVKMLNISDYSEISV
jgi:glucose-1-phosphate thymidylyltransferase